jgi:hypothetical protein
VEESLRSGGPETKARKQPLVEGVGVGPPSGPDSAIAAKILFPQLRMLELCFAIAFRCERACAGHAPPWQPLQQPHCVSPAERQPAPLTAQLMSLATLMSQRPYLLSYCTPVLLLHKLEDRVSP